MITILTLNMTLYFDISNKSILFPKFFHVAFLRDFVVIFDLQLKWLLHLFISI